MPRTSLPKETDNQKIDYYKLELTQAVERINSLENTRMQLGMFFGTANVTILGVALYLQKAGAFLIAAMVMLAFLLIDRRFRAINVAYFYRGLQLQKILAPKDKETFLQLLPGDIATEARIIIELQDSEKRRKRLLKYSFPIRSIFFQLAILIVVGETVIGLLLWYIFKWTLL